MPFAFLTRYSGRASLPIFGVGVSGTTASADWKRLRERGPAGESGKQLRSGFMGFGRGPRFTSAPDCVPVLGQRAGLFNLATFAGMKSPQVKQEAAPHVAAQVSVPQPQPVAAPDAAAVGVKDPVREATVQLDHWTNEWLEASEAGRAPDASAQARSRAPVAQYTLMQNARQGLVALRKLERDALADRGAIHEAKLQCVRAAIVAELPGVEPPDELVAELLALDEQLTPFGGEAYGIDRLLSVICNYRHIRDCKMVQGKPEYPLAELRDMIGLYGESLATRDGSAMNVLFGEDPVLDATINAARVAATARFMESNDPEKTAAKALVNREMAIAKANAQLRLALAERTGQDWGWLNGAKMNDALVKHLRDELTPTIRRQVGMVIAALYFQQRAHSQAPETMRMLEQMERKLKPLWQRLEKIEERIESPAALPDAELQALRAEMHGLKATIGTLAERIAALKPQFVPEDAICAAGGLEDDEIRKLGLQPDQVDAIDSTVRNLAAQGVSSADEARKMLDDLNAILGKLHARGAMAKVAQQAPAWLGRGNDESEALRLGEDLLRGLTGKKIRLNDAKGDAAAQVKLALQGTLPAARPLSGATELQGLHAAVDALRKYSETKGVGISLVHPKGYDSCRKLQEALELQDMLNNSEYVPESTKADWNRRIDKLCRDLQGFDLQRLHTPSGSRRQFTRAMLIDIAADQTLRGAINGVVAIRSGQLAALKDVRHERPAPGAVSLPSFDLKDSVERLENLHPQIEALRRYSEKEGKNIDPANPKGYDSCIKLRRALRKLDDLNGKGVNVVEGNAVPKGELSPVERAEAEREIDRLCRELRGFDIARLHTPKGNWKPFTRAMLEKVAENKELRDAVDGVIAVRGELPTVLALTQHALAARRAVMGHEAASALRDTIRAAILAQLGTKQLHSFRPAEHAEAVKALLVKWGVDVELYDGEIKWELTQQMSPNLLNVWEQERRSHKPAAAQEPAVVTPLKINGKPPANVDELMECLPHMQEETQWSFAVDDRGTIRFFATDGLLAGGVDISAAKSVRFSIKRNRAGFHLLMRQGVEGSVTAHVSAGVHAARAVGTRVDVGGSLGLSGAHNDGVYVHFGPPAGAAVAKLMKDLVTKDELGFQDLSQAANLVLLSEKSVGVRAAFAARAGLSTMAGTPEGKLASPVLGFGAEAAAAYQSGSLDAQNTNAWCEVSSWTGSFQLSVSGSAALPVGLPSNPTGRPPFGLGDVGGSVTAIYNERAGALYAANGQIRLWERFTVVSVPHTDLGMAVASKAGGEKFDRLMEDLKSRNDPLAGEIEKLVTTMRPNDTLSIGWALDPDILKKHDALMRQAQNHADGSTSDAANALRAKAIALREDKDNHVIDTIRVFHVSEESVTKTPFNLIFVRRDQGQHEKGERSPTVLKMDALRTHRELNGTAVRPPPVSAAP